MPTRSDAAARVALLCFAYFHIVPISSYFSHSREGAEESEMIDKLIAKFCRNMLNTLAYLIAGLGKFPQNNRDFCVYIFKIYNMQRFIVDAALYQL